MNDHNIATVRHFYDSLNNGSFGDLFARFAPNIDWRESAALVSPGGSTYTTPALVPEEVIHRMLAEWADIRVRVMRYVTEGNAVVALGLHSGVFRATGKRMSVPFAHVWTIENDQVVAFRQYVDGLVVQQATVWSFAHPTIRYRSEQPAATAG